MIRKAKKKDLSKIFQILKKAYAERPYRERWVDKNGLSKIRDDFKKGIIFVLEINKEIIGFITVYIFINERGKLGYIEDFVIKKKFRGKNYGRMLHDRLEKYLKKKRVGKIELMTSNKSKAFKIYKKWGFVVLKDFMYMTKKIK